MLREVMGARLMRIKIRVLTKRQEEADFILNQGRSAFGDPIRTCKTDSKEDADGREQPPPAYGATGETSVGVG